MTEIARTITLEGIATALRLQRQKLGMSQLDLDAVAGLANGHTGKLEASVTHGSVYKSKKGLGRETLPKMLSALGLELAVVPAMHQPQKHQSSVAISGTCSIDAKNYWRRRTLKARTMALDIPEDKRRARARKASRARWDRGEAQK